MRSGRWQEEIAILLPQRGLEDFPGRGMRNFGHKYHVVGQPPVRHLSPHVSQDLLLRDRLSFLGYCDQERALAPFRMLHADNSGLANLWVASRKVLKLD